MALKVYARHGGAAAATTDDITARVPFLDGVPGTPIVQMGMSVQNGGATQGTVLVPDPTANFDASLYFPPRTQITLTEDATGDELMLAQGRISAFSIGRAPGSEIEDAVEWTLTIDDANVDLRGLAFTEDWVRPAETGTARLYALALYTLNGTSSTRPDYGGSITYRPSTVIVISSSHLAPDTETTVMPAKTYPADTQPQGVVDDCATTEGKVYGVVPHHVGGASHLCMLYIKESDHSTYSSTVKISDQLADWDPDDLSAPVFEPWWDQGKGQRVDGNAFISGVVSRFGSGTDQIEILLDTTLADSTEYWVEGYQDGQSVDITQAFARATAIIAYRSPFAETDFCSIEMDPAQHHLLTAGMSIQVKTAVVAAGTDSTLGTYVNRRVMQLQWEPRANGKLHAILQLNRPTRGPGVGQAQPASTSPRPAPECAIPDPGGLGDEVTIANQICEVTDGNTSCGEDACSFGGTGTTTVYEAITAGTYWTQIRMGFKYAWSVPGSFIVQIRDSTSVLPDYAVTVWTGILPHGNYYNPPVAPCSETVGGSFTVDAGYDRVRYKLGSRSTGYGVVTGTHQTFEYTPPGEPIEDDPFCLDNSGDSPYYMRTDDPRFLAVVDELNEVVTTAGFSWKRPVRIATTAAGTLATSFEAGDTIDGVVLAEGDRLLIKDQAAGADNGVYIVAASGAPSRAADLNQDEEANGAAVFVSEGTANGNTVFVCTTNEPITLGTTALVWAALSGGASDHGALTGLGDDDHPQYMLESLASAKGELWGASANDTPAMVAASTEGQALVGRAAATSGNAFETQHASLTVTIGNGVNVLTTGVKGYKRVPFACEIVRASLGADVSGSAVIDVWVDTHANYPPTVADTITASAKPTLSSAIKYEDTTLTGWTKPLAEGSWIGFNVDSATTIKQLEVELRVKKT